MNNNIKQVVIVGGGTAGWMAAAAISKVLGSTVDTILVESEQIGTVGVGEATIPSIRLFNNLLGLDENEFLKRTNGTIKLGIEFNNWNQVGDSYLHAFGGLGLDLGMGKFFQYWLRQQNTSQPDSLWDYSFNNAAARAGRFERLEQIEGTPLAGLTYAFHFDAGLYAAYLREVTEARGVTRIEGVVTDVMQNAESGFIEAVRLDGELDVRGDLFIDCSGFRGLLIEQSLQAGYADWSEYLPCDRAIAVPCESAGALLPFTKSTALEAGWQWRIPLQHRIGNGHVYCSGYLSDQAAEDQLLRNLDGAPTAEPKQLRFKTGMRNQAWLKNCVALGLSSGFMEPLESTSIHLIQSGISRLLNLFPTKNFSQVDIDEFNRQNTFEFERIRDFLILHYKANSRQDSDFWQHCANMPIPDSLAARIDLYKTHGRVFRNNDELFTDLAWIQVLVGQGIVPESYHPIADTISQSQLDKFMLDLKTIIKREAGKLSSHEDFILQNCGAVQ